uniref:Uncharacterized protein n=1 Tax=Vespula pensylvanica TaxID=30213 RepID=A0A834U7T2_VESPE|nr:hypothetical protein H0235_010514 [Vespula pensylvanica]
MEEGGDEGGGGGGGGTGYRHEFSRSQEESARVRGCAAVITQSCTAQTIYRWARTPFVSLRTAHARYRVELLVEAELANVVRATDSTTKNLLNLV